MGLWNGIGNGIGRKKRGIDWSSYWTPQYQAVLDYWASNSVTEPSDVDKLIQARMVKKMVDGGYWNKAELLDMFSTHVGGGLVNWKAPGTNNPSKIGTPQFQKYAGYRGWSGSPGPSIRTNFLPRSEAALISQNNACMMIGVGDDIYDNNKVGVVASDGSGLSILARHSNGTCYVRNNSDGSGTSANTSSIKYYTTSRSAAAGYQLYLNKVKTNVTSTSKSVPDIEMYACAANENGTVYNNKQQLRFLFLFSYLTEAEVGALIDIMEEYFTAYHTNLIGHADYIATSSLATKTQLTLTTYDGSGQTCNPSVVNCGEAWNGYQYWMANTPFPGGNTDYENPSIWASEDGTTWVVPDGLTNPVVAKPSSGFNADTSILFDNNKLYVVYKESTSGTRTRIIESSDGVTWSSPKTILTPISGEAENQCPTLIKIGSRYYIYYGTWTTTHPPLTIKRVSCDTIDGTYGNRETVNIEPILENGEIWHFDIKLVNGTYYMVTNQGFQIYISKSTDGINFTNKPTALIWGGVDTNETQSLYRPCLATIGTQPTIYYGTVKYGTPYTYGCAKINVTLV